MGQAKRRGTYEQRKAEAVKARKEEMRLWVEELWDEDRAPIPMTASRRRAAQALGIAHMIGSLSS